MGGQRLGHESGERDDPVLVRLRRPDDEDAVDLRYGLHHPQAAAEKVDMAHS
ncbi:MAG TPA: hypothetical protein VFP54_11020 [Acidimicrobiales bacterium]|nr:hypothetical protein [Acidimicrobiales bacterium]